MLERLGFAVDYYAPEPAGSYIEAWGGRVLPVSREVESLSVYLEEHWVRSGTGVIGLRGALREHKAAVEAGLRLLDSVDVDSYDAVVAEESWEIMSVAERIATRKVWIADFVGYRSRGLKTLPASWAVNRFLLRRYPLFDLRIYVGLPGKECSWRMTPRGPRAVEVLNESFETAGPVPAFLPGELAPRSEARRVLGIDDEDGVVLVQLGGTAAGSDVAARAAEAALRAGLKPVVAPGPRARPRLPRGAVNIGYQPHLPRLLRAFDCAYTLAGLSTIASLAAAGVPAVLHPLPGHFEQEENADLAPRIWPGLFRRATGRPEEDLEDACARRPASRGDEALHDNTRRVADLIEELVSGQAGI